MAVLRVFDVPDEDGMRRYWDAHATNGALELEPGHYELVLRQREECPDCEGQGVEGEAIPSGHPFQPDDIQGCPTCGRVKRALGVAASDKGVTDAG
jgi:hypothetical protein